MKTVLITGTSRGLGLCLAQCFLQNNYQVVGLARSKSVIDDINYRHYQVDLGQSNRVQEIIRQVDDLDIIINNAAVYTRKNFVSMCQENIAEILKTNLVDTIINTKIFLDKLSGSGKIVFINSVAGLNDIAHESVYCASKQGLKGFANVLAKELKATGKKVISIYPGGINTSLWSESNPYPGPNLEQTLDPVWLAQYIFCCCHLPRNVEIKNITIFPETEYH